MYSKGLYRKLKENNTKPAVLFVCLLVLLVTGYVTDQSYADSASSNQSRQAVLRNRVFSLKHISATDAKSMLSNLGIGRDINAMPGNTTLVFTSDNVADMKKAQCIIKVIDSKQKFQIMPVLVKPDTSLLSTIKSLDKELTNVAVGSFSQPPFSKTLDGAIIDMHGNDLIVIAPADQINNIKSVVQKRWEESVLAKQTDKDVIEIVPSVVIEQDVITSSKTTEFKGKPEFGILSRSLEQSTGPVSEPEKEDLQAAETAIDKTKSEIKTVVVEEKKSVSSEDELFADLLEELEAKDLTQAPDAKKSQEDSEPVVEPVVESDEYSIEIIQIEKTAEEQQLEDLLKSLQGTTSPVKTEEKKTDDTEVFRPAKPVEINTSKTGEKAEEEEYESLQPKKEGKVTIPISMLDEKEDKKDDSKISGDYKIDIPGTDEELDTVLDLPQEVEISDLLELVGKQLGINYMYDPAKIRGKVMLKIHDGKIKVKDLYALVESVMKFRGFVMTRRNNLVTVVPMTEASNIDPVLRKDLQDIKPGDVVVASIFQLKHISTADAIALLRNMKLGLSTQPIEETKTLIVTEYAYRMTRVAELLNMVDVKGEPRKFVFRELKHTTASNLTSKVETLAGQLGSVSVNIAAQGKTSTAKKMPGRPAPRSIPKPAASSAKGGGNTVYLDVDERTNRILMIGLIGDLRIVNELIDSLDVPKRDPRKIFQYEIQYVDASEILNALSQLGIISSSGSRSSSYRPSARPTTARPTTTKAPTSAGSEIKPGEEPQVVVLGATNSLLINATNEQHDQISMIIAHVDRELEEAANPYVIYRLENQAPEDMAETLDKIVNATLRRGPAGSKTTSRDPKVQGSAASSVGTSSRDAEDEIVIVPDESTFSIIVYASRKNQEQIARMIEELDKRRPQVLIDVTLVEIFKNDDFQYDLELITSLPTLASTSGMVPPSTWAVGDIVNNLANADGRKSFQDFNFHGGNANAFYADNHIQALLQLMETKEYGRVMAQPKILVNDNEPATIDQKKTIYIARTSQVTNTNNSSSDTSFLNTSTSFDSFPSGIDLAITPHISEGNLLRLEIELNRSQQASPGKTDENEPPPDLTENNINTIVTVPDKSTIILGGISEMSQSKQSGKIPILGDLPIIGGLFQSTTNFDKQAKLYIFVKAYILRPEDSEGQTTGLPELVKRSDEYRAAFEAEERKFHEHSWGTFNKENPMPPLKALEEK